FHGYVPTTEDALCLIMAARRGILPRVTRRLTVPERQSVVKSGAIFIFCEKESGIKRWVEGLSWSPSRVAGNFLVKRSASQEECYTSQEECYTRRGVICVPKQDGLIKKTITVKTDGLDYHLISYYTEEDVRSGRLQRPSSRPDLRSIEIPRELLESSGFRYPLKCESQH
ncbi:Gti1/Pac2 family-domain-containing protein, partial [Sparassis latifolia]